MKKHARLAVLLLPAALLFTACEDGGDSRSGSALSAERVRSAPTTFPAGDETLPPREPAEDGNPVRGPKRPRPDTWYPHDFFAHCGLTSTEFAGRTWILQTVHTDLTSPVPYEAATGRSSNYVHGYIQLAGKDLAVFVSAGLPPLDLVPGTSKLACD
ncbi:hypothetical protein ACIBI4_06095 [Streptomyces sp. NPDC050418]|uniref:hypothetical protein n=1 Tax=Streptomyces sp. NPDC050418 TaxID=3365612 RepID=UPI0037A8EB90